MLENCIMVNLAWVSSASTEIRVQWGEADPTLLAPQSGRIHRDKRSIHGKLPLQHESVSRSFSDAFKHITDRKSVV